MPINDTKAVDLYLSAWNETDAGKRDALLAAVFAEDGTYQDPNGTVAGRQALGAYIAGFQQNAPQSVLVQVGRLNSYDNKILFTWTVKSGAAAGLTGHDFGCFDAAGRFQQIVGFFEAPPAG